METRKESTYRAPSVCQEVTYMTSFYLLLGSHDYFCFTEGKNKKPLKKENQDVNQVCPTPKPVKFSPGVTLKNLAHGLCCQLFKQKE